MRSPKMSATGAKKPLAYILGESPGVDEDEQGRQFVGKSGRILRSALGDFVDRCRFNNTLRCHPPGNRDPEWVETECCRTFISEDIEQSKPIAILGFGGFPLTWATGQTGIGVWRGRRVPVRIGSHVCWYFPIMHPAALLHSQNRQDEETFDADVRNAVKEIERGLPTPVCVSKKEALSTDDLTMVTGHGDDDLHTIDHWLSRVLCDDVVAFDIETASDEITKNRRLRPYGKNARILSVSISGESGTLAFAVHHRGAGWRGGDGEKAFGLFLNFLTKFNGEVIAQNLAFELEWLIHLHGLKYARVCRWHDTMAQAYILDERAGALGLDDLCMLRLGLPLKSLSNLGLNDLDREQIESVLRYNALDSKYTRVLFFAQEKELEREGLLKVYDEQVRRTPTLVLSQIVGMQVDQEEVRKHQERLENEILDIADEVRELNVAIDFKKRYGKEFNPGSPKDVMTALETMLGIELEVKARGKRKGSKAVDEEVLEKVDHPLAQAVLKYRELVKLKSTYIDPLSMDGGESMWSDGKIHTQYRSCRTRTRRTSADAPNVQNYPKHQHKEVRSQIVAEDGHTLVSVDFGQIQFRAFPMVSHDPKLIEIIKNRYDVHMEWARRFAKRYPRVIGGEKFLNDKDAMKLLRQKTKNQFVFPTCFGAQPKGIGIGMEVPENICASIQNEFFDMFPGLAEWQRQIKKFYRKHGYVEGFNGFRRRAPMTDNEVINTPIQCAEEEIVLDAMNRLSEYALRNDRMEYQPPLEIHDDLTFQIPDPRLDECIERIVTMMLDCPFEWVNVPLSVEVSIGRSWHEMKEIGVFFSDTDL